MMNTGSMVIIFPILLLMFMGAIQWGLYFHGQNLVRSAAQDGARRGQQQSGTRAEAEATARQRLGDTDSGVLSAPVVQIDVGDAEVTAQVWAHVPVLVPLPFDGVVYASVSGPKERFVEPAP
jgi:Flp pilus assembly protein TadG